MAKKQRNKEAKKQRNKETKKKNREIIKIIKKARCIKMIIFVFLKRRFSCILFLRLTKFLTDDIIQIGRISKLHGEVTERLKVHAWKACVS